MTLEEIAEQGGPRNESELQVFMSDPDRHKRCKNCTFPKNRHPGYGGFRHPDKRYFWFSYYFVMCYSFEPVGETDG